MAFQLERTQWWADDRLLAYQLLQLDQVIGHAARHCPHYRESLADLARRPLDEEAFRKLPILTREMANRQERRLRSEAPPTAHGPLGWLSTTGSTGLSLEVGRSFMGGLVNSALMLRFHTWHERDLSLAQATIDYVDEASPRPRHWAPPYPTGPATRWDSRQPVSALVERLLVEEPAYLSVMPELARTMIERCAELGRLPRALREVMTFGEVVEDEVRERCREVWGVRLTDHYSCQEVGILAAECPQGGYHVQSEQVLLEVLDEDGNECRPGQIGRVVVSALHNFASPLIRYELGDMAEVGPSCSCGRGLPVLRRIHGRARNLVRLPNGDRVHPVFRADAIRQAAPSIRQYQLVQDQPESIEVRIIAERAPTAAEEAALARYLTSSFGHAFEYRIRPVDRIERGPTGKVELFRCTL